MVRSSREKTGLENPYRHEGGRRQRYSYYFLFHLERNGEKGKDGDEGG